MAIPQLIFEHAAEVWTEVPQGSAWRTLAASGEALRIIRGRATELQEFDVGLIEATLRNTAGDYWPHAAGAPRSGDQLQVRARWAGTTYDLAHGVIEEWRPMVAGDRIPRVNVTAPDLTRQLSLAEVTRDPGYPQQRTDQRVAAIADDVSYPAARRDLPTGQATIAASGALANAGARDLLRQVQEVEFGLLYVAKDGRLTLQARNAPTPAPLVTLGPGHVPMFSPELEDHDRDVANHVTASRTGGTAQTVEDAASQVRFSQRPATLAELPLTSDAAALGLAQAHLNRYREPRLELRSVTLRPHAAPDILWPAVLGAELGASVAVEWPTAGIMENYRLEGIELTVFVNDEGAPQWEVIWRLTNPPPAELFWALGVVGQSELGESTRLFI